MRWIAIGLSADCDVWGGESHWTSIATVNWLNRLTCNLPRTLISTPPSNIGCESMAVIIRLIFWNVRLYNGTELGIIRTPHMLPTCNFSKIFGAPWICWPSNVINESSFCKESEDEEMSLTTSSVDETIYCRDSQIEITTKRWCWSSRTFHCISSRNTSILTLYMLTSELRWFGSSKSW